MSDQAEHYRLAYERECRLREAAEQAAAEAKQQLNMNNARLETSLRQLKEQQQVLIHQEKMATLGMLAAGVAHEINNPMAYVHANLETLTDYLEPYQQLVQLLTAALDMSPTERSKQKLKIEALIASADLNFFQEDLPGLMADTREGLERVREIIGNLRSFARTNSQEKEQTDLVSGLSSTVKLLSAHYHNDLSMRLNLDPVPPVYANPGELNQVFLNLLINACHAVEGSQEGIVRVQTSADDQYAYVDVIDNGCGMTEAIREQIFTPFFTTKPVGQGTGMGMSIAYGIVTDHGGDIEVKSTPAEGSHFRVKLPVAPMATDSPD